jgi:hypothetical protein
MCPECPIFPLSLVCPFFMNLNVFEGSYMNSSYSTHAAHTNEYIYNFLKLPNK